LCVEVTHKVLRTDTVLQIMNDLRQNPQFGGSRDAIQAGIEKEIVGTIIMTTYNRKTYRVDEILWDKRPRDTFPTKKGPVTYEDYYQNKYQATLNANQPMLLSNPKPKDIRRGMTDPFIFPPELCQMTGLTEKLRENFQLMKALGENLHMVSIKCD